jgi:hypothetical protein
VVAVAVAAAVVVGKGGVTAGCVSFLGGVYHVHTSFGLATLLACVSLCSINNTYACENPVTLGWLKNELGFDGYVMSDWGATHRYVPAGLCACKQAGLAAGVAVWWV